MSDLIILNLYLLYYKDVDKIRAYNIIYINYYMDNNHITCAYFDFFK